MKTTVLFDLGNTLVSYYELPDFPRILEEAIGEAEHYLRSSDIEVGTREELWKRVTDENHEAPNYEVRPLEERLARIFALRDRDDAILLELCRRFMRPIFALGALYDDVLPALEELRALGCRIGLISNSPWGSPAALWREELDRLDLARHLDHAIFCRDTGWRKPAPAIFHHALERIGAATSETVFVGDDPRWDIAGPAAIGMDAILVDRGGDRIDGASITSLRQLPPILEEMNSIK